MSYHVVYQLTNLVNGKIYIGAHSTSNLDDGYMGSGKAIINAVRFYGKGSFKKEYLHYCNSVEQMLDKERELVTEEFTKDPANYNIKIGGTGGWQHVNRNLTDEDRQRISRRMSEVNKGNRNNANWIRPKSWGENHSRLMKGREITWKDEISKAKANKVSICHLDLLVTKFVTQCEADRMVEQGWRFGTLKSHLRPEINDKILLQNNDSEWTVYWVSHRSSPNSSLTYKVRNASGEEKQIKSKDIDWSFRKKTKNSK